MSAGRANRRSTKPKLLFVTHVFPPDASIGARRCKRIAVGMRERGWDVTVLTAEPLYHDAIDDATTLGTDGITVVRTHAINPRAWAKALRDRRRRSVVEPLKATVRGQGRAAGDPRAKRRRALPIDGVLRGLGAQAQHVEIPDSRIGWLGPALLAATALPRPDIVLTSSPWYSNIIAGAAVARLHDRPLLLDYRDPWTDPTREAALPAWRYRLEARLEDLCLAQAAALTATSPSIAAMLRRRVDRPTDVIYNATDPADFVGVTPREFAGPTLLYTGGLYAGRRIEPLLDAMAAIGGPLRLHYMGLSDAPTRAAAIERGMSDRVTIQSNRPRAEACAAMLGARANVCIVAPEHHRQIPGKLLEQLGCGRPVLLLGPPDCDALDIARGIDNVVFADLSDTTAIADALSRLPTNIREIGAPPGFSVDDTMAAMDRALRAAL